MNNGIQPISNPGLGVDPNAASGIPSTNGNVAPTFRFTQPITDVAGEIGDLIDITWTDSDPDDNAVITILLDPDNVFGNGNEIVVLSVVLEDDDTDAFPGGLDTGAYGLKAATYRIIARISDGVNPEAIEVAPGRLLLFGAGMLPANISPSIIVTEPMINYGVSHNDTVNIAFCGSDPDDSDDASIVPDIVLLLDLDDDPFNEPLLDFTGPNAEDNLLDVCFGGLPRDIGGAIVLACFKDNDCNSVANATQFPLTVDVSLFPPRPDGEPYRVRTTMWDHTNLPVHSYAPGNISITALGSGTIDLGQVGRTISGTKFMGFNEGDQAGSTGSAIGDISGDGVNDFVLVSRFGQPSGLRNVGTAHVILGLSGGQKFGNEISLNSIGTLYPGRLLAMQTNTTGTDGIISVCRVGDVTGDGRSEILFGIPYFEAIFDYHDDDPCDCDMTQCPCYGDLLPNPLSETDEQQRAVFDGIKIHDRDEDPGIGVIDPGDVDNPPVFCFCSNDMDPLRLTPIDGGYAIMVGSQNSFTSGRINLSSGGMTFEGTLWHTGNAAGQSRSGGGPFGARWRGPWYDTLDYTQTVRPFAIIPDNRFGQTVRSMPDMTNTSLVIPANYGPVPLISAPHGAEGRGMVTYHLSQNFTVFCGDGNSQSFPCYESCGCSCPSVCRTRVHPGWYRITGAAIGDELGYADAAGDYNLDGSRDIVCGAPGADRDGVIDGGIVYIMFGRPDFTSINLEELNPPRMEIRGTNNSDRFGEMQTIVGDMNQDGLPDIGFASQYADGPGGVDSGFIGIIFGGRRLTGENIFTVNQVTTPQLPGVKIYGTQPNGRAGSILSNVGDFNGDGVDDMLICACDEFRTVNGQSRRGVAYLLFGGPHMINQTFHLSQVGTSDLPGMIFVSPYEAGSAEEAVIDSVAGVDDINGDGFADILIGVSFADYVNPLEPSQRRVDSGEAYLIYGSNTGSNTRN
ncbi:MAG: FG-GAP repeat protein [Planctomycetota bacterium]